MPSEGLPGEKGRIVCIVRIFRIYFATSGIILTFATSYAKI